jgi:hypothetical protein
MILAGCGSRGSNQADFSVIETESDRSSVTVRIEVSKEASTAQIKDWATKNAKIYSERYSRPVTMHFYRGGRGPEYYIAIYHGNQFTMLR